MLLALWAARHSLLGPAVFRHPGGAQAVQLWMGPYVWRVDSKLSFLQYPWC